MEGPAGLLRSLKGFYEPKRWNRSTGLLTLRNGSKVYVDGADDGALRVQGKNLRGAWCDEIGLWRDWERSWKESLRYAIRMSPAKIVATGTPKQGHPLVKLLLSDPRTAVTHMRTYDNVANLDPEMVEEWQDLYAGTRWGRQELEGEFLEDAPGALWTLQQLEDGRIDQFDFSLVLPRLSRVIVGVDPSGSRNEDTGTSEQGIVVAGFSKHYGHGYVMADVSVHETPERWGRVVCNAYHEYQADAVVAERNYGGEMVRSVIHAVDPNVPVKLVNASRGKLPRAEPIAAKYEQGKVHHVQGTDLSRLEEQMVTWVPGDPKQDSPDRVDALVWALTELMLIGSANVYSADPEPVDDETWNVPDRYFRGTRHLDKPDPWTEPDTSAARSYSSA